MATLTTEQAERIKAIIDQDASLVYAYLDVKGLSYNDRIEWDSKYEESTPKPHFYNDQFTSVTPPWVDWHRTKNNAWAEHVNATLLPDNVIGACVIGGLTLAACSLNPEHTKSFMAEMFSQNCTGIGQLNNISNLLFDEFGLTRKMLLQLQHINDHIHKTKSRHIALKARVDLFVTEGDDREYDA